METQFLELHIYHPLFSRSEITSGAIPRVAAIDRASEVVVFLLAAANVKNALYKH